MPIHNPTTALPPANKRRLPDDIDAGLPENGDAVALLRRRIAVARVLREHIVWEAVRVLPALSDFRAAHDAFARFRQMMEHDDFAGAILHLAASSAPARELLELTQAGGIWSCRLTTTAVPRSRRRRIHTAHHPDRAACLLAALVASGSSDA